MIIPVMLRLLSQLYNSGNRKIRDWHSTGDLSSRHIVMYNWSIPVQIIHKALDLQNPIPEITILSIFGTELSQVVEGLKPNLRDATCKFEGCSFASVSQCASISPFQHQMFLIAQCYLIFQRLWLIWHDSSLIRAQTPACSAGVQLGEPFILALDCFAAIYGLISLFFTCLSKSSPCIFSHSDV